MKWKSSQQDIPFHRLWKKLLPASFFFSSSRWMFLALFWSCHFLFIKWYILWQKHLFFPQIRLDQRILQDYEKMYFCCDWTKFPYFSHSWLMEASPAVGNLRCHSFFFSGMFSPWIISGWKIVFWHKHMLSFKLLLSCIAPKKYLFCRL